MNVTVKKALVLGATGSIGREVAHVLLKRGWRVRALHRDPESVHDPLLFEERIEWFKGDAMRRDDIVAAGAGAALIVHAVNPPKYHNWRGLALPMLDNTIAAARSSGARVLFPGTIYNFGPDGALLLTEESPQRPVTRKGKVRVEMEERLQRASELGVRTIVVRAGDFFGPGAGNSWLTRGLVRSRGPVRSVWYPGSKNVGHAWAYLPDLAETMVRLVEQEERLADFDVFHFRGHWFERGVEIAEKICFLGGISARRIKPFPWWAIKFASPFVEVFREMVEMQYLWQKPVQLSNAKLLARLGVEPHTPLESALIATLGAAGINLRAKSSLGASMTVTP